MIKVCEAVAYIVYITTHCVALCLDRIALHDSANLRQRLKISRKTATRLQMLQYQVPRVPKDVSWCSGDGGVSILNISWQKHGKNTNEHVRKFDRMNDCSRVVMCSHDWRGTESRSFKMSTFAAAICPARLPEKIAKGKTCKRHTCNDLSMLIGNQFFKNWAADSLQNLLKSLCIQPWQWPWSGLAIHESMFLLQVMLIDWLVASRIESRIFSKVLNSRPLLTLMTEL